MTPPTAAVRAPKPDRATRPGCTSIRRTSIRRAPRSIVRPTPDGNPDTMVAAINRTLKDEMAANPHMVVFGEDIADATHEANLAEVPGKGGVFKVTLGLQRALRLGSRLQFHARGGRDRRPGVRHGHPRTQAGGRDSVLRLHLAGDDAAPRRSVDAALSLEQHVLVPDGHSRRNRRVPARRRVVPQPVGREHLRALPGSTGRLSLDGGGCRGASADVDSLRGSGAVPRAQASLSPDLQQGRVPGPELHDSIRPCGGSTPRHRRRRRDLGRDGATVAPGRAAG